MTEIRTEIWTAHKRAFRIDLRSNEPVELHDQELIHTQDIREVVRRCMTQVARTSYMVGQPNREVYWKIEQWNSERGGKWEEIANGRSKIKDRPMGKRYPKILG
jgi:hypothetical protein